MAGMLDCSLGMIGSPSFNLYLNACALNQLFNANPEGSCTPACRRALFDYFAEFNSCWAGCDTGGVFDLSSMQDTSAEQMALFTDQCGGTTTSTGDFRFTVTWGWSFTNGDPHFTTLDGASYTYVTVYFVVLVMLRC